MPALHFCHAVEMRLRIVLLHERAGAHKRIRFSGCYPAAIAEGLIDPAAPVTCRPLSLTLLPSPLHVARPWPRMQGETYETPETLYVSLKISYKKRIIGEVHQSPLLHSPAPPSFHMPSPALPRHAALAPALRCPFLPLFRPFAYPAVVTTAGSAATDWRLLR